MYINVWSDGRCWKETITLTIKTTDEFLDRLLWLPTCSQRTDLGQPLSIWECESSGISLLPVQCQTVSFVDFFEWKCIIWWTFDHACMHNLHSYIIILSSNCNMICWFVSVYLSSGSCSYIILISLWFVIYT